MKITLLGLAVSTVLLIMTSQTLAADGKAIYVKSCAACHSNLPPRLGDKVAWEPRIKLGIDVLVASVLKGKGAMPAKGGNAALSEADIKAAVDYMLAQLK